jgi:hypothetical protein
MPDRPSDARGLGLFWPDTSGLLVVGYPPGFIFQIPHFEENPNP